METKKAKAIDTTAERITNLEPVAVPILAMKAALSVTGQNNPSGYYLDGIHLKSVEGRELRVAASDRKRIFIYSMLSEVALPSWLEHGVIIPAELLGAKLKLMEQLKNTAAVVYYAVGAPRIVLADPHGECQFRMAAADGVFPEYDKILDRLRTFEGREVPEMSSVAYLPAHLKSVGSLAAVIESKAVRLFPSFDGGATIVTFPDVDGAMLILQPDREATPVLGRQTSRLLAAPTSGTIAALRAHRTRWEMQLADADGDRRAEIEEKMADYDRRIAEVLARTHGVALPAPGPAASPTLTTSEPIASEPVELVPESPPEKLSVPVSPEPPIEVAPDYTDRAALERELAKSNPKIRAAKKGSSWHVPAIATPLAVKTVATQPVEPQPAAEPVADAAVEPAETGDQVEAEAVKSAAPAPSEGEQVASEATAGLPDLDDDLDSIRTINQRIAARAKLGGKRRQRELLGFKADVNALLSEHKIGLTLGPDSDTLIAEWFRRGMRPLAAARLATETAVPAPKPPFSGGSLSVAEKSALGAGK